MLPVGTFYGSRPLTLPRVERVFTNAMALTDFTDGGAACNRRQDIHKLLIAKTRLLQLDSLLGI